MLHQQKYNKPANNASFATGSTVTINALQPNSDGTIAKVEFFQGTNQVGRSTDKSLQFRMGRVCLLEIILNSKSY